MTPQSPHQFGICSWSVHPENPAQLAQAVKNLGLDKVQLALNPTVNDPDTWADVKKILADDGIDIASGMIGTTKEDYSTLQSIRETGGFVPDQHWEANFENVRKTAALASQLQLSLVSVHAGFLPESPEDPSYRKILDRIACVANEFAQYDITLLFETGQETATTLLTFLENLDQQTKIPTAVNFDPANMILYDKGDPVQSLAILGQRVAQVHIKDATYTETPGTWGTEVPIGEGDVDWRGFLDTLAQIDFTGNLIIEREAGDDRAGDVKKAIDRLSTMM